MTIKRIISFLLIVSLFVVMNIVPAYAGSGNGQNNQLRVITITVEGNGSVQVIVDEKVMLTVGSNETQEYTGNHKESVV